MSDNTNSNSASAAASTIDITPSTVGFFASTFSFLTASPKPAASKDVTSFIDLNKTFSTLNSEHTTRISGCTANLKAKLNELQQLDMKIVAAFAAIAISAAFSALLPFSLTITAAAAYALGRWVKERETLANEYRVALSDAVDSLEWAVGDKHLKAVENMQNSDVQSLRKALLPLMSDQQLRDKINDKAEDDVIAERRRTPSAFLDRNLNEEQAAIFYELYGYEKGGLLGAGKGLWYLAYHTITSMVDSFKKFFSAAQQVNETATAAAAATAPK